MSVDLEHQIRAVADAAFEQTSSVRVDAFASELGRSGVDRRWLAAAAAALTGLLVGALAWAGGSGDQADPVDTPVPVPTDGPTGTAVEPLGDAVEIEEFSTDFSARAMLQEIPLRVGASPVALRVSGLDLALISQVAGVERTGSSDPSERPSEWFDALFLQQAFTLPYSYRGSLILSEPTVEDELGFGFLDIDHFVSMSPYAFGDENDGYLGDVDVLVLRSDMSELAAEAGDDSIIDLGEGADGDRDLDQRTALRSIGRPLRLGVDAERSKVSLALTTPTVNSWLGGAAETLADVGDLFAAAAALDLDDQLYAAELDISDRRVGGLDDPIYEDGLTPADILIREEFTTIGWGSSGVGDTQRTTIVYVFADEVAASASIEPIATLYSPNSDVEGRPDETVADLFALDAVAAVGRTVVVSGRVGPSGSNEFESIFVRGPRTVHR